MQTITAWQRISPEVNVKGFGKCCISNAMDETDDGMLWNDSEEGGNIRSQCEEDESTECEDGNNDIDWKRQIEFDMSCILSV